MFSNKLAGLSKLSSSSTTTPLAATVRKRQDIFNDDDDEDSDNDTTKNMKPVPPPRPGMGLAALGANLTPMASLGGPKLVQPLITTPQQQLQQPQQPPRATSLADDLFGDDDGDEQVVNSKDNITMSGNIPIHSISSNNTSIYQTPSLSQHQSGLTPSTLGQTTPNGARDTDDGDDDDDCAWGMSSSKSSQPSSSSSSNPSLTSTISLNQSMVTQPSRVNQGVVNNTNNQLFANNKKPLINLKTTTSNVIPSFTTCNSGTITPINRVNNNNNNNNSNNTVNTDHNNNKDIISINSQQPTTQPYIHHIAHTTQPTPLTSVAEESREVLSLHELLALQEEKEKKLLQQQQSGDNTVASLTPEELAEIEYQRELKRQRKEMYRAQAAAAAAAAKNDPAITTTTNQQQTNDHKKNNHNDPLADWPQGDNVFTFHVGALGKDATDEMLTKLFQPKFPSFIKARVCFDRDQKPKGYGFVCFSNGLEMAKAFSSMNGEYCGERRMSISKADIQDQKVNHTNKNNHHHQNNNNKKGNYHNRR